MEVAIFFRDFAIVLKSKIACIIQAILFFLFSEFYLLPLVVLVAELDLELLLSEPELLVEVDLVLLEEDEGSTRVDVELDVRLELELLDDELGRVYVVEELVLLDVVRLPLLVAAADDDELFVDVPELVREFVVVLLDDELVLAELSLDVSEGRTFTLLLLSDDEPTVLLLGVLELSFLRPVSLPLELDEDELLLGRVELEELLFSRSLPDCAAAEDPGRLLFDVFGRSSDGLLLFGLLLLLFGRLLFGLLLFGRLLLLLLLGRLLLFGR